MGRHFLTILHFFLLFGKLCKGAELGKAQPGLGLGLKKFDLNNVNGRLGKGLNVSFGPTDKADKAVYLIVLVISMYN